MDKLAAYVLVALGSALGGVSRYWVANLIDPRFSQGFPWSTLIVNITGSFAIGVVMGWVSDTTSWSHRHMTLFLATGFCGGYTTFSAFSLQTLNLLRAGQYGSALANAGLSVSLCVVAVWAGYLLGSRVGR